MQGIECKYGHSEISLVTGACLVCQRDANKRYSAKTKPWRSHKKIEYMRQYRIDNADKLRAQEKEWWGNHKDTRAVQQKEWRDHNGDQVKLLDREWRAANPDKSGANAAKRRSAKLQRTPNWLTKQHHAQILRYYTLAQGLTDLFGVKYSVDHIHPLQGETVSGLHVPWNLQVMTLSENISKSNRF